MPTELNEDEIMRSFQYRICTAIDLIKLGTVLTDMMVLGGLDPQLNKAFHDSASALLKIILHEKDKLEIKI